MPTDNTVISWLTPGYLVLPLTNASYCNTGHIGMTSERTLNECQVSVNGSGESRI